jgi:phosphoribosylanthranilate isomerase
MNDMLDTRIKICGITSPDDARLCASAGADYLGVIFAPGERSVSIETARAIRAAVPATMLVGVFENAPLDDVGAAARACGLNMIQLHGQESPEYCSALLARVSLPIIKALGAQQLSDPSRLLAYTRTSYFMLDLDKNHNPGRRMRNGNGTRERLWSAATALRAKGYRIFLAGGLSPASVRDAVRRVAPYGVDVAAGVESSPGVKDPGALRRFISEVKQ